MIHVLVLVVLVLGWLMVGLKVVGGVCFQALRRVVV